MKKFFIGIVASLAFLTSGCASLPEGARKMTLNINSVQIATQKNVEGFIVDYTVHHSSSEPMPIDEVRIKVLINGKVAGVYNRYADLQLENRKDVNFQTFVPANRSYAVARESLKKTPMLYVDATATVDLIVDEDSSVAASAFNVSSTYTGIIHGSAN